MKLRKIVGLFFLLLVCAVLLTGCGKSAEETFAEKYFEAILAEDWETIYDMTDFGNSPFVTKEKFVKAMAYNRTKYNQIDIAQYAASKVGYKQEGKELTEYNSEDAYINYTTEGSNAVDCLGFSLIKDENGYKAEDFFDCVANFTIEAPRLATVSIDDIEVSEEYLVTENKNSGIYTYNVPIVFGENITLKVYGDEIVERSTMVNTMDFKRYTLLASLTEEAQDRYIERAIADRTKLVEGYINNTPFEELNVKFTTAQYDLNNLEQWYNAAMDVTHKKRGYGLKERRIVEAVRDEDRWYTQAFINNKGHVECKVEFRVYEEITYSNGNSEINDGVKYSDNMTYVYSNGEYLLAKAGSRYW